MISVRNGTWLQIHVSMQMVKYIFKTKGLVLKIREYFFLPHSQCYKHVTNILAFPDIITLFRWSGDWENLKSIAQGRNVFRMSFGNGLCFIFCGPGYLSRHSNSLWAGRSRDRIPVGAKFSAPFQPGPGAHPASYGMGTGCFPEGKAAGAWRWPPTSI